MTNSMTTNRKVFMQLPFLRRALVPGILGLLAPTVVSAQECLGLHRPHAVPTVEVAAGFLRDGITGPSTLSVGAQHKGLFAIVETGADQAAKKSAFSVNGFAATAGVRRKVDRVVVCAGVSLATEDIGGTTSSAQGLLAAAGLPITMFPKAGLAVFGAARLERRSNDLSQGKTESSTGAALRIGASSYPTKWLGLRVFEDFANSEYRTGFSVSAVLPLKR